MANGTLHLPFARLADGGIYQCFASNAVGANSTALVLNVTSNSELSDEELEFWHRPGLLDHLPTVPPSKPKLEQSGRDSALIEWQVPNTSLSGEMMPIQVRILNISMLPFDFHTFF